jgi:uncharacterized membrane protein YphA (DoxX/SURF4 family)
MNRVLWIVQILLALLFLFAGVAKFVMPVDQMIQGMPPALASGAFLHFIAICEVVGAIGLIVPALLRIKPGLTPLAAAGLVIIMIGAIVVALPQGLAVAMLPLVTGLLLAFVAWGRWRIAPL